MSTHEGICRARRAIAFDLAAHGWQGCQLVVVAVGQGRVLRSGSTYVERGGLVWHVVSEELSCGGR